MLKHLKLAYISIPLLLCVLLCFTSLFYVDQIHKMVKNENFAYLDEVAQQNTKSIQHKFDGDLRMLEGVALTMGDANNLDVNHWVAAFEESGLFQEFQRIGVILPNGMGYANDIEGTNFSDREYFKQAMAGKHSISDVLMDRTTNVPSCTYAVPIYHNKQIIGVLAAVINTSMYEKILSNKTFDGQGYTYIINSDGNYIVHGNHSNSQKHMTDSNLFHAIGKDEAEIKNLKKMLKTGQVDNMEYVYDNEQLLVNFVPLQLHDWYVVSVVPYQVVMDKSAGILNMTMIATGFFLFCIIIGAIYVSIRQLKNKRELEQIAYYDDLTGFDNNVLFCHNAEQLLGKANHRYAYVIMDIRKFKVINDIFGYVIGDKMLCHITSCLKKLCGDQECASRNVDDIFSMLLRYEDDDQLQQRLNQLMSDIASYAFPMNIYYRVQPMFGIYRIHNTDQSIEIIQDRGRLALEHGKQHPQNEYNYYQDEMRLAIIEQQEIENDMEKAILNEEFQAYLQPQYDIESNQIVSAEALVRWIHPTRGMLRPDLFIPLFEENGFITILDEYMFEKVCMLLQVWHQEHFLISVNQSRMNLYLPNYANRLMKIADTYGVPRERIMIEITESAFLENPKLIKQVIDNLRNCGFKVSIDDFGSGYSSFNLLQEVMVDEIKIDKQFFHQHIQEDRSKLIVGKLIEMMHLLKMRIVAEGVEQEKQLSYLQGTDCHIVQGYYYYRPLTIEQFYQAYCNQKDGLS